MWPFMAVGLAAGAGAMAWAVRGRSSAVFAPSVWRGNPLRNQISLTFDDGPSESTPELLEILDRFRIPATFFLCGHNVERLPDIARLIVRSGHEIGNHTWSHRRLDFASPQTMDEELGRTQTILTSLTGKSPTLFRAPYGVRWPGLGRVQARYGLIGMMWTTIGLDWKCTAAAVSQRIVSRAGPGHILCLHDGRGLAARPDIQSTLGAVREIIPRLQDKNLAFVAASAILEE